MLSNGWPEKLRCELHLDHELIKTDRDSYNCDGCNEMCAHWSYYCKECDFDLHPECALEQELAKMAKGWPKKLNHELHKEHELTRTRDDDYYWCFVCARKGFCWSFSCKNCDFYLHPDCALDERIWKTIMELPEGIKHEQHEKHELRKTEMDAYWCDNCAEDGHGPIFYCHDCDFGMHPSCVVDQQTSWPQRINHALHELHVLSKTEKATYNCDGCGMDGYGLSFCCNQCDFDMHPKCATELPEHGATKNWPIKLANALQRGVGNPTSRANDVMGSVNQANDELEAAKISLMFQERTSRFILGNAGKEKLYPGESYWGGLI